MNILCCMPDVSTRWWEWSFPPIGIAYISSALKQWASASDGVIIHTHIFAKEQRPVHTALRQIIDDYDIDVVMCGYLVSHHKQIKEILDAAKAVKPDIITVTGGGIITYSPLEGMTIISSADYGVIGEGEITICELMEAVKNKSDISKVDGIVYRAENGERVITNERTEFPDLDALPFPDYEGLLGEFVQESRSAAIVTSRTCPYRCTFCSATRGKPRIRSMDSVFSEIDFLVEKYNITSVLMQDDLFSVQTERIIELCDRIRGYNLRWLVWLRVSDALTLDILRLMKEAGCRYIYYGLESADDRILKSMNKGITVAMMERVLSLTKEAGIDACGTFIFGDPEETEESVNNTIQWVNNHRDLLAGNVLLIPIILYPGSPLYRDAVKNGIIDPLEHILNGCPHVNVSKLSDEYFSHLINEVFPAENTKTVTSHGTLDADIKFCAKDNGTYEISTPCHNCSQEYRAVINADVLCIPVPYEYVCAHCNHREKVSLIPSYASWIDGSLLNLVESHNCVMWPAPSSHYMMIHKYSDALKHHKDRYGLINSDARISTFEGKKVHAPDFLASGSADTAIIFSANYHEIIRNIRMRYPHIKPVIFHDIGLSL